MMIPKKIYLSALLGVFLEYFDYTLYGFSAPLIAHAFFPEEKPSAALILSWGIFALSFVMRPFGAVIFGHFADRVGRRIILMLTIVLMSIATISIGLLPTYARIGIFAPFALMICRILQGLAVSTEYSGCSTYLLEFSKARQGLNSGIITSASGFGVFAASLLVLLLGTHWRIPFIIAGVAVGTLGIYLRKSLAESPDFLVIQQQRKIQPLPFLSLIRNSPKALALGIVLSAYTGIAIIVVEIYLPSYCQTHLGMSKDNALRLSTYLALLEACLAISFGWFSDIISRRNSIFLAGALMLIGIFPAMHWLASGSVFFWFLSASLLAILVAAMDGPIAAFLTASFPTEIRYTGVSVSYNVGAALMGGLSPAILEALQNRWPLQHLPAGYLFGSALIMLLIFEYLSHRDV